MPEKKDSFQDEHPPVNIDALVQQVDDLAESLIDVTHQVTLNSALIDDLRERQRLLADSDGARGGADPNDSRHLSHIELARRFELFLDQDLKSLAFATLPYFTSRAPKKEWIARLIGMFSLGMFRRAGEVDLDTLGLPRRARRELEAQASDALAVVVQIFDDAARVGLQYHFDYYFRPGRKLDGLWQEAWGPCDPELPGKFLVAPAYVVDRHVFLRQRVYTTGNAARSQRPSPP